MEKIYFFTEDSSFNLKHKSKLRIWVSQVIKENAKISKAINFIFTSDKHLLSINQQYLNHDTLTDVITFNFSSDPKFIETDIYISIDRIQENADRLNNPFPDELHRVMIHGILHILGYNDKNALEKKEMRKKENHYLALLN